MANDYIDSDQQKKQLYGPGNKEHPIWRGIGCILVVIVPIFSYLLSRTGIEQWEYLQRIIRTNQFFSKSVSIMDWDQMLIYFIPSTEAFFETIRTSLNIQPIPFFWGTILIALVLSFIIFGVISILYSMSRKKQVLYKKSNIDVAVEKQLKEEKKKKRKK